MKRSARHRSLPTWAPASAGVGWGVVAQFTDPDLQQFLTPPGLLAAKLSNSQDIAAWQLHSLVGMEVGPTGAQFSYSDTNDARYCSRLSGAEIVRNCAQAGAEYVVVWARDGDYAYYESRLLPKAPGLGIRDPLRESVEEARKHKLPVIAYCVVQQAGQRGHAGFRELRIDTGRSRASLNEVTCTADGR